MSCRIHLNRKAFSRPYTGSASIGKGRCHNDAGCHSRRSTIGSGKGGYITSSAARYADARGVVCPGIGGGPSRVGRAKTYRS